jgi:hypothetical protein
VAVISKSSRIGNGKSASVNGKRSGRCWLKANFVVDRISQPLLATKISLRRLNADMSEQKLDLLKLPTGLMAQAGTGTAQIVRRNAIQAAFRGPSLYDAPDDLRTETSRCDSLGFVDRPKDRAGRNTGGGQPVVDGMLDPYRDGNSSHVSTLAHEICNYPMLLALLEVLDGEPGYLCSSEAATEENRDHGIVPFGTQARTAERSKESLPLISSQPIPDAHSVLLHALYAPNSRREIRTKQPAVSGLVCQPANGGKA